MKKLIIIILILSLWSCKQNNERNEKTVIENTVLIDENKIQLTESNDLTKDNRLKVQMDEYMKSILIGDIDKLVDYCYPDIYLWIEEEYPGVVKNNEDFKKVFFEPMRKLSELKKNDEVSITCDVGEITKRFQSEDGKTLVYLIVSSITIKHKFEERKNGDENVAISTDGGEKWKLMIKDEEMTREILGYKFSNESINKLLN